MKASELRIGNVIKHKDHILTVIEVLKHGVHFTTPNQASYAWLAYEDLQPIPLSKELLLKCGAYQLPHFTVMDTLYFDLGRNRELSLGCVGSLNLFICIQEIEKDDNGKATKVNDIICTHNWDYDGEMYLHRLQNLYHALKGEELNIKL